MKKVVCNFGCVGEAGQVLEKGNEYEISDALAKTLSRMGRVSILEAPAVEEAAQEDEEPAEAEQEKPKRTRRQTATRKRETATNE